MLAKAYRNAGIGLAAVRKRIIEPLLSPSHSP
jgi:hypothetical protein